MVKPAQRKRRRAVLLTFRQADTVCLHERGAVYLLFPVGVLRIHHHAVEVGIRLQLRRGAVTVKLRVGSSAVRIFVCRPIHIAPLVGIEHVKAALICL